jgi:cytosine deaminase
VETMSAPDRVLDPPIGWAEAWDALQRGLVDDGWPIGASVVRPSDGVVLASGHNRHRHDDDHTAHAEMVALRQLRGITLEGFRDTYVVTTLMPCWMCTGAIIHLGIPKVFVGLATLPGAGKLASHRLLEAVGVQVIDLGRAEAMEVMQDYISTHADWAEDMGTMTQPFDLSRIALADP